MSELAAHPDVQRIVAFQSSASHTSRFVLSTNGRLGVFGLWFPKVYLFVRDVLQELLKRCPWLRMPFKGSVFACFTINFGPWSVCFNHRDYNNAPGVPCAITALGEFDHTRGGHLVLFDYRLVVEFPARSTAEILSACVHHGNTSIQAHEWRSSVISYMAGGYVAYGFRLEADVPKDLLARLAASSAARAHEIVGRFSTLKSVVADRLLFRRV
jgi:hypothetical protein